MRCAEVKALHTISAVSGLNPISAVSRSSLNLCDAPPDTPLTQYVQNEIEARLSTISFSAKGSIVSLVKAHLINDNVSGRQWLDILDGRSIHQGKWKMLRSMCFHQLVEKRKDSSYCNEGVNLCRRYKWIFCFTVQLVRMSNQILQDQGNVLQKMYGNLQSECLKT